MTSLFFTKLLILLSLMLGVSSSALAVDPFCGPNYDSSKVTESFGLRVNLKFHDKLMEIGKVFLEKISKHTKTRRDPAPSLFNLKTRQVLERESMEFSRTGTSKMQELIDRLSRPEEFDTFVFLTPSFRKKIVREMKDTKLQFDKFSKDKELLKNTDFFLAIHDYLRFSIVTMTRSEARQLKESPLYNSMSSKDFIAALKKELQRPSGEAFRRSSAFELFLYFEKIYRDPNFMGLAPLLSWSTPNVSTHGVAVLNGIKPITIRRRVGKDDEAEIVTSYEFFTHDIRDHLVNVSWNSAGYTKFVLNKNILNQVVEARSKFNSDLDSQARYLLLTINSHFRINDGFGKNIFSYEGVVNASSYKNYTGLSASKVDQIDTKTIERVYDESWLNLVFKVEDNYLQ
ncbi:MAG: hypothetical protein AB8E15_11425 [Bdellovibrionales bacterium]